jgi:hypothetical protein
MALNTLNIKGIKGCAQVVRGVPLNLNAQVAWVFRISGTTFYVGVMCYGLCVGGSLSQFLSCSRSHSLLNCIVPPCYSGSHLKLVLC